ncbi:hypothetical protein KVM81_04695 [Helicobacter pylori]|nr:hypothetical protein KVM81_04695 [Helicobacter pylori]
MASNHSTIQPFNHSTIQPFNHSTIQSFNHSIIQSFNHSIIQSFNHSIIQSFKQRYPIVIAFTKTHLKIPYFLSFPFSLTRTIFLKNLIQ